MKSDFIRALAGEEIRVDLAAIEKTLAEIWRSDGEASDEALTRAALWNVVAHTDNARDKNIASSTLSEASEAVPQRTIVIQATPADESAISSWISANCHMASGGKQICSEEISIVAGGERIHYIPPLVSALLIPDMPVAAWWVGDLPSENEDYVTSLLDPADRLIVDSSAFDDASDLRLLAKIASGTNTSPADLTWSRLEEWRLATASIFDAPEMRRRLGMVRSIRIVMSTAGQEFFGESTEALYFAAWAAAQLGHKVDRASQVHGPSGPIEYEFEWRRQGGAHGRIIYIEIRFEDGSSAAIERNLGAGALLASVDGVRQGGTTVTRLGKTDISHLIVRQLAHPTEDLVYTKSLPIATRLADRFSR